MLMTDEEAGKKVCKQVLWMGRLREVMCLGSRCARWEVERWGNPRVIVCDDPGATEEPPRPSKVPASYIFCPAEKWEDGDPAGWVEPEEESHKRDAGRCASRGE